MNYASAGEIVVAEKLQTRMGPTGRFGIPTLWNDFPRNGGSEPTPQHNRRRVAQVPVDEATVSEFSFCLLERLPWTYAETRHKIYR